MLFSLSLSVFILAGCGVFEDDDDDDNTKRPELTITNLMGTYTLTSFDIYRNDGVHVNQDDFDSWSGDMSINADGDIYITTVLNGEASTLVWEILQIDSDNNSLNIYEPSSNCEEWLDIDFDGNDLALMFPQGECIPNGSLDFSFSKTSASVQSLQNSNIEKNSDLQTIDLFNELIFMEAY
ncbi:MAG: hypothetical protein PVI90_12380 [Desulfobacteraceae bacterium]